MIRQKLEKWRELTILAKTNVQGKWLTEKEVLLVEDFLRP